MKKALDIARERERTEKRTSIISISAGGTSAGIYLLQTAIGYLAR